MSSPLTRLSIGGSMIHLDDTGFRMVRQRYNKTPISDWLASIYPKDEADKWMGFYLGHPQFQHAPASVRMHHKWSGGLEEHIQQMIGICLDIKQLYCGDWCAVSDSDIIIGCFIHDLGKIWKYEKLTQEDIDQLKDNEKGREFKHKDGPFRFVTEEVKAILELSKYGIQLTEMQAGALLFAEGGYSDAHFSYEGKTETSKTGHSKNQLAVLISIADLYSAALLGGS